MDMECSGQICVCVVVLFLLSAILDIQSGAAESSPCGDFTLYTKTWFPLKGRVGEPGLTREDCLHR